MVTKGIITSIDFNGNTCQVRIPLFETAGNDPITGTAIVSNTPGSYNGYKVGDVVLVAFEDGKMQNPVIVGKLYLGAAKEKQDPRGTINVETTTASKSASLPADAVLTVNVDSNVPNTNTPFGSLASIANNLNSLNTDVNQLDRFTRNQFNSVITDVNDQGEQLRSEIKQTAENIENKVVHKHKDGSQDALGWNLDEKEWKINAKDTVNGVVKDINIVTIDRSGMSIAGDLKLSGYPKNTTVLYAQTNNDTEQPQLYEFTNLGTSADKTWYYGKYIKLEENKYVLVLKENFEYYEKQGQLALGATIAYSRKMASGWSMTVPGRADGKYIWQWTHTEIYSFDEVNNIWNEEDNDKVVCITGATGSTGEPATIYWASFSTAIHTGKNQASNIEIIPYAKTGNASEVIDTTAYFKYSLDNGTTWNSDNWTLLQDNKIIILAKDIIADNIIVKLAHARTDTEDSTNTVYSEYETETITYSPLNTPVLDLNNDSAALNYTTDGTKINANDKVSSTATLYLNGEAITTACYIWYLENCTTDIAFISNNKHLITNTISINGLKANAGTATCLAFKDKDIKAVVVRSAWSEADWTNFSTGEQTWTGSDALEENEYFVVIGRATDSKKFHVILGQAIDNINGEIRGKTVSYDEAFTKVFSITKQLKGDTGIAINNTKQWYILWPADSSADPDQIESNTEPAEPTGPTATSTPKVWMSTPPEAVNGHNVWTCYGSIFSDDPGSGLTNRHITYSTPVKDNAYALAQGKTTNYYSPTEPVNKIKIGDCWFDTGYVKINTNPENKAGYLGKFVVPKAEPTIPIPEEDKIYVKAVKDTESDTNDTVTRYIPIGPDDSKSTYLVKITPKNIDNEWFIVKTEDTTGTDAYETGNLKQCSSLDADGNATWTDIAGELVTNKLTANYINAMDITAKRIEVKDSNNSDTLFLADGINGNGEVKIGGFTVDSNRLYAGTPGADNGIELASSHKLIAYKSNNQGVASSYAVSKITVNKDITNLTVYIRSYADPDNDYTMISNPNVSSYPTSLSSYVKAHTRSNQNSSSELTGYTEVEYYGLKQNDWIYVVYMKDGGTDLGTDTGYLLIPETAAISIETVNGTDYTFERDPSFDTKKPGASLKVGSNFSVDSTGAIKSTSGTIGKLAIDENGLSYGSIFKIDTTVDTWGFAAKQKATVVASSALVKNTLILPGQSQDHYDQFAYYWPAFDDEGFKVLYTANWEDNSKETYKLGEYKPWDLAGIPIVSTYNHFMTLDESLACFKKDLTKTYGWGAPIIYTADHISIDQDWVEVDLSYPNTAYNIRKILTVVCTSYVQPTMNTNRPSTAPTSYPNQTGNLFVSYDNYSNGKFWIRSSTDMVTVSILAIGVAPIKK